MEREIEIRRNQLLGAEAGDRGDPDMDDLPFEEEDADLAKRSEHLEEGDLEYKQHIKLILKTNLLPPKFQPAKIKKHHHRRHSSTRVDVTNAAAKI
jgi:hypothetical protein